MVRWGRLATASLNLQFGANCTGRVRHSGNRLLVKAGNFLPGHNQRSPGGNNRNQHAQDQEHQETIGSSCQPRHGLDN